MLDLAAKKRTLDVTSSYCMLAGNRITRSFTPLPENIFEEATSNTPLPVLETVPPEDKPVEMASPITPISVVNVPSLPEFLLAENIICKEPSSLTTLLPVEQNPDYGRFKQIEASCTISNNTIIIVNNETNTVPDTDGIEIDKAGQNSIDGKGIGETEIEGIDQNFSQKIVHEKDVNSYYNEASDDQGLEGFTGERNIIKHADTRIENIENDKIVESTDSEDNLPLTEVIKQNAPKGYKKNGEPRKRKKKRKSEEIRLEKARKFKLLVEKRKVVLPPCSIKVCRKKCISIICENKREQINASFWSLTEQERRNHILASCLRLNVQKRRETDVNYYRKNNTFKYFLKDEKGESKEVCKTFYLTTLGFHKNNDRLLHDVLSKTPKHALQAIENKRGKTPNKYKIDANIINEHINSFNPTVSHYRREHAPNRLYLPSDVSITLMYEDFKSKFPDLKVSYDSYRVRVKEKNISFAKLGQEECETCEEFNLHHDGHTKDNFQVGCVVCDRWQLHIKLAVESRELYQEQADMSSNGDTVYVSVDLQKVIMLPRIDGFKRVIFSKRLIAYNESFVALGSSNKLPPFAVLWNESISGRNKEDIISAFFAFMLSQRDVNCFVFWLDNCSSQNKNWCFLTFLLRMINSSDISANEIMVNYFEPGHSFMAADSFHHQIELSLKRQGKIYDFYDFVNAISKCRMKKKPNVKIMNFTDFYLWKDLGSRQKVKHDSNRPLLANIKQLKATRGSFVLKYKNSFDPNEEFKVLDFLCKKAMKKSGLVIPITCLSRPQGFPKTKKDNLVKLLNGIIPESRQIFWENLPECEDE